MDNASKARRATYRRLMKGFAALDAATHSQERWAWLMAAHVVGQLDLRLHLHSHCRMLGLAWSTRDWPEARGQLFRLVLVPVGHALQRLPAGNVGRATVNAFWPMEPDETVRRLIRWASQIGR